MSITGELREYAQSWRETPNLMEDLDAGDVDGILADFEHIADRIDAEHQKAIRELNNLADTSMLLPVDANGETIHVGDEMEGVDKYDSLKKVMGKVITVSFESNGVVDVAVQVWDSDGKSWHRAYLDQYASVYRHYHEPTVEDVLREFAEKIIDSQIPSMHPTYEEAIAEYATKLRLANSEE